MTILLTAALLPAIFLIVQIYKQDKIEKEPKGLLVKLFVLGMLSIIPAIILETGGELIVYNLLPYGILLDLIDNFIVVAMSEEACKYFMLKKGSWKHPAFGYRFDAVVYAVIVSLGFAALENVEYVLDGGLGTALLRAFLPVPGHAMFGLFMGLYYGQAKKCENEGDDAGCKKNLRKAFFVPALLHGFYDFAATETTTFWSVVFYGFVIAMYIISFKRVRKAAAEDVSI